MKLVFSLLAACMIFLCASAGPANADWHGGWHGGYGGWHHHGWGWGLGGLGLGLGLGLGASYYGNPYYGSYYAPTYYGPDPYYSPYWGRPRVYVGGGGPVWY